MGGTLPFEKETLIIGVLSSREEREEELLKLLEGRFGRLCYRSGVHAFTYTGYYDSEMGPAIRRFFLAFEELIDPQELASVKLETNRIEEIFSEGGNRKINLDPGLLNLNRLALATTKNAGHRIPLHAGIYAEVTLFYTNKAFQALPWTYPDYRSEAYQNILTEIRGIYLKRWKRGDHLSR